MRGRKPVPTQLKLLRGNPGRRPINDREPTPAAVSPNRAPPSWLDAEAKREWRRLTPLLARNGLLTELDVDALALYCVNWITWRDAVKEIRENGAVTAGPNGFLMQSPHVGIANRAMQTMRSLMADFGMSPSSRSRVTTSNPSGPAPANPLEKYLRRP